MRAVIVAVVRDAPGLLLSQLRRRVGGSAGTLQYHLRMLEQAGLIVGQVSPRRHRLFPAGMPPADRRAMALLRSGRFGRVADVVLRHPGIAPASLGAALALTPRAVRLAIGGLAQEGLVLVGTGSCCWPAPALQRLLGGQAAQAWPGGAQIDVADALRTVPGGTAEAAGPRPAAIPVPLAAPPRQP